MFKRRLFQPNFIQKMETAAPVGGNFNPAFLQQNYP